MLGLLKKPEGTPIGKPFVISFVLSLEQLADGRLMKKAAKEAESRIINDSISANAILLGHYFPQIIGNAAGVYMGVYMAVQPYAV